MESPFESALALHRAGRLEEAEALYRQVTGDQRALALANLGVILRTTGRLEAAEAALREALRLQPDNPSTRHTLGMTLLQLGQYAEGWRVYESRRQVRPMPAPPAAIPEWRGGSLAGKRLLVVAEQGLGDQILMARFLPALDADEVAYASARPLVRLLSPLATEVFNTQSWEDVEADAWTYLGMVPQWLELGPDDAPAPYLPCPPRALAGVGLMLEGKPTNPNNAQRLPTGAAARALRGLTDFVDLAPEATGARDFADTADIVAGLEAVVTVDTSVAHLAGAMGKACYVMMPARAIDWWTRWDSDRTPWYPSVRLIRQRQPGDWASVILGVGQALGVA